MNRKLTSVYGYKISDPNEDKLQNKELYKIKLTLELFKIKVAMRLVEMTVTILCITFARHIKSTFS